MILVWQLHTSSSIDTSAYLNWLSPFSQPLSGVSKLQHLELSPYTYMQCTNGNSIDSCKQYLDEVKYQKYKLQFVWANYEYSNYFLLSFSILLLIGVIVVVIDVLRVIREWKYTRLVYNLFRTWRLKYVSLRNELAHEALSDQESVVT